MADQAGQQATGKKGAILTNKIHSFLKEYLSTTHQERTHQDRRHDA